MKRLHAIILFLYLIACLFGLLICEAWRWGRREWKQKRVHK